MLKFKSIQFKNFLSFGNHYTNIQLDRSPTTLITGENGAGKSTFLDALTFSLYGKPFRKVNKGQLVNSINKKQCVVEIQFSVGAKHYLIRRGIKPNVFEIYESNTSSDLDNEENMIPQAASVADYQSYLEKNIIKMNYEAFTQIVILGKATYIPFMRLDASKRRGVIEDLLGLKVFGDMSQLGKEKIRIIKGDLTEIEHIVDSLIDKIDNRQRYVDEMKNAQGVQLNELKCDLNTISEDIDELESKYKQLSETRDKIHNKKIDVSDYKSKKIKLNKLFNKFENKVETLTSLNDFLDDNDVCPTCSQTIDDSFKLNKIDENNLKNDEIQKAMEKISDELDDTQIQLDLDIEFDSKISKIDRKVVEINSLKKSKTSEISKIKNRISKIDDISMDDEELIISDLHKELSAVRDNRDDLRSKLQYYQTINQMLKDDGIKTLIINKYLPLFNQLINEYLLKMGFITKFTLDEQFNEQIMSRYRDNFNYNSFSEGQKLRIDLAILMTWREISKIKNSLNTNLLIMDEVFDSSLDQDGIDAFVDILPSMGDTNVFVVSHTGNKLQDKFRSHMGFKMNNNFSEMVGEI